MVVALCRHTAHWRGVCGDRPVARLSAVDCALDCDHGLVSGRHHQPTRGHRLGLGRTAALAAIRCAPAHPSTARRVDLDLLAIVPAAFAGVAWGILGGALPGISPSITMALLLPLTYTLDATVAIVMLASTYVG